MPAPTSAPSSTRFESKGEWLKAAWVVAATFGAYFSMYGFRKPFTAATYAGDGLWGIDFKTVLVIAQVAGYMISKFVGIRVIAEMPPSRRAAGLLWLILVAEFALVLFGLLPRPWNVLCLFLNGLPLGMVFGLVQGFLEGRRLTELLSACLCASFILADGVTKTVGSWLLEVGVSEAWMPATAGGVFLFPLVLCTAMLSRIAPPSAADIAARSVRLPMSRADRVDFLWRHAWGLIPLVLMYLAVTVVRSLRADFAPEIWRGLGVEAAPGMFTRSEIRVALGVLAINGAAVLIVDNRRAFSLSLVTCAAGFLLMIGALLGQQWGTFDGFTFMVLVGLGLYLPYVAMHTTVFERMIGLTRERANLGFLMYVSDAFGYLGYVVVMLVRHLLPVPTEMAALLTAACWLSATLSLLCLVATWWHFVRAVPAPAVAEVVA